MLPLILALAPVFALILAGWGLRRIRVIPDPAWSGLETLVYYVFFPSLLFLKLATADLGGLALAPMGMVLGLAIGAAATLLLVFRQAVIAVSGTSDGGFTAVFQGCLRPNSYVALGAASALFGAEGETLAVVAIAAVIPLVNIVAVLVLQRYSGRTQPTVQGFLSAIVRNPIIIACTLGFAWNLSGIPLASPLAEILDLLARAALPLGLMAVGAGLDVGQARAGIRAIAFSSAVKLVLLPLGTLLLCQGFDVRGTTATIAMLFNALPVSAASYVLTRQMGGDGPLMAGILTAQTVLSAATLPLLLAIAQ